MDALSDSDDVAIVDLSSGGESPSEDAGSLIDSTPPSAPASPVLGAGRAAGRAGSSSQMMAGAGPSTSVYTGPASPALDPEPGPSSVRSPGPSSVPSPGPSSVFPSSPVPGPSSQPADTIPTGPDPGYDPVPGPSGTVDNPVPSPGPGPAPSPGPGPATDTGTGQTSAPRTVSPEEDMVAESEVDSDSDVEIPLTDASSLRAAIFARALSRRRASDVWRDTDFQPAGRAGAYLPPPAEPAPAPAAAREHVTPAKDDAGGFVRGEDARSPGSEDGQCCTICFESWSNSGEHRIASLRCGHLFGKSCIERWLRGREQRCPQCNAKACRKDVRVIFAKSLRVLDTTDRDRALEELDREREARRRLELDFAVVQVKCQLKENQIEKLQAELRALQERVGSSGGGSSVSNSPHPAAAEDPAAASAKLSLHSSLEVSRSGGCRVLEHNSWLGMLVASQPSSNTLFPGHGVRKINTLDMRPMQFVSLHQKQIRDISFSPEQRDLLLSVSLDRRAKITNVCANTQVQTYECPAPVWSCAWDSDSPYMFYAGLQSGAVMGFDTRAGTDPLCEIEGASPVVALRHVPRGGPDFSGGLLVCRLADCKLYELGDRLNSQSLPLAGPFASADFDARTRHLLVSSRPSSRQPHAQHAVCRLRRASGGSTAASVPPVSAEVVQVFRGGTGQRVLSRSALVPHPLHPDAPLVCASLEPAPVTQLWDLATGECAATLAASEPALDVRPLTAQDRHFLALLTEKTVKVYRWEVT